MSLPDEFPYPDNIPAAFTTGTSTPAGLGSNPVEAVPVSQEAIAESETRIATGATPYAIVDETAEQMFLQQQAKQVAPFDDPSILEDAQNPNGELNRLLPGGSGV